MRGDVYTREVWEAGIAAIRPHPAGACPARRKKDPELPVRACLLSSAGKMVAALPRAGKKNGIIAVTHRRLRGWATQVPAVVLGKDAALADARDEAGMRLIVGLFRLLGDGSHAQEYEAGTHTARLDGGIVGGCGDGAFPRGPAQTDMAISKGRGKAFSIADAGSCSTRGALQDSRVSTGRT